MKTGHKIIKPGHTVYRALFDRNIVKIIASVALFIANCENFEEINTNHDTTTTVSASLLCTEVILDFVEFRGKDGKVIISSNALSKYIGYANESQMNEQYNKIKNVSFNDMTIVPNIAKMEKYAEGLQEEYSYKGIARFARAYKFYAHTMELGDIPYSEVGLGANGIYKPKYDLQENVLFGIVKELEEARDYFARGKTFSGDPTPYNGDPAKWLKAVNSFLLKVLMSLSAKTDNDSLDVVNRFSHIALNSSGLLDQSTNYFGLAYSTSDNHPLYDPTELFTRNTIISSLLIDNLKKLNDRRLYYYAEPSELQLSGYTESDPEAYVGVDITMDYPGMNAGHASGSYSLLNKRYAMEYACEPRMILTYAEQQLILAEAVLRGWIPGSAKDYYEQGVMAALSVFKELNSGYAHGMPIDDGYMNNYFTGEAAFKPTIEEQLKQIWMQRYILHFMQGAQSSFFEYRRNKYPEFPTNPATSLNENNTEGIPMRCLYPLGEYNYNSDNLQEALERQYNGWDEINQIMWVLR